MTTYDAGVVFAASIKYQRGLVELCRVMFPTPNLKRELILPWGGPNSVRRSPES